MEILDRVLIVLFWVGLVFYLLWVAKGLRSLIIGRYGRGR